MRRREMERLFAVREAEGLSLRELSEQSGIPVGTLSWWSSQLRQSSAQAFREVLVRHDDSSPSTTGRGPALRLRLPSGLIAEFDGELAERIGLALLDGEVAG